MTTTTAPEADRLLGRVRKLLAKAEDPSVTVPEAQALTAKAAALMAKYGIDRALLAVDRPETDKPGSLMMDIDPPWAAVTAALLAALAKALRCAGVVLPVRTRAPGRRVHVFGYESDIGRLRVMFPSIVLQMGNALSVQRVPPGRPAAWRRSFLLGYIDGAIEVVKSAEAGAEQEAGTSAEVALRDRSLLIDQMRANAYPLMRNARVTYSGNGFLAGQAEGRRVNLGGAEVSRNGTRSLR